MGQVIDSDPSLTKAVFDCLFWKVRVMFLTGKTFFLAGSKEFSVPEKTRGTVMIIC
jgi:hypothetical protein